MKRLIYFSSGLIIGMLITLLISLREFVGKLTYKQIKKLIIVLFTEDNE